MQPLRLAVERPCSCILATISSSDAPPLFVGITAAIPVAARAHADDIAPPLTPANVSAASSVR
ncbi:Uncharacterised protein [Mycobacteroides abscessus subsp. abscessus]|nr:Uncharacterised protein [Mycobacteroides abscessus subsp. abscessus]